MEKSQVDLPTLTTCQTQLGGLPRAKVSSQLGPSAQSSSYPRVLTFHGAAWNFQLSLFCKCLLWVVTNSPVLLEAARVQKSWARILREEKRIEQNRSDKFTSLTCSSVTLWGFCWTLPYFIQTYEQEFRFFYIHFIKSLKFFNGSIVDLQCVNFCCTAKWLSYIYILLGGFPGGTAVKNPPANVRDTGSIPGLGRSPGVGNGNPLQYSCLGNSMDRRTWQTTYSPWGHRVGHDWATKHICIIALQYCVM